MKVAFIGMGTMGAAMALNILKAGHEVTVTTARGSVKSRWRKQAPAGQHLRRRRHRARRSSSSASATHRTWRRSSWARPA